MNLKKRIALFIAVIMMVAVFLPACGKTEKAPTSDAPDTSTSKVESKEEAKEESKETAAEEKYEKGDYTLPIVEEETVIRWMGRDSEEAGTSFLTSPSIVWDEVQKRTGITVEWDVVPNQEYREIMGLRLASKQDMPDIISLAGQADGSTMAQYFEEGVLMPIQDLIADYCPATTQVFEEYPEYRMAVTLPTGEIVGLGDLTASTFRTKGVSIRKDWLDKFDLEPVHTMDELFDAAKIFVENDANGNGEKDEIGIVAGAAGEYRQLGMAYGLSLVSGSGWSVRDGVVTYEYTLPEYKDFLTWMNRAYNEGILPKDFQTAKGEQQNERIASGVAGIRGRDYITSFMNWNNPTDSVQKNTPDAVWMPVDFHDTDGYTVAVPREPTASIWRSYCVTNYCENPVVAVRLLDYVFAGEGRYLSTAGQEGVTFNWVNDKIVGVPNWRETVTAGTFMGDSYSPKITGDAQQLGALESEYLNADPELKQWSEEVMQPIADISYPPFQPAIPTVENGAIISRLSGDMNTYRDEAFIQFVMGERSLDDFDTYVEEINSLGAVEIQAIYQEGYDNLMK